MCSGRTRASGTVELKIYFLDPEKLSVVDMSEPKEKAAKMATELDQLKDYTVVVADTGDFEGEFQYNYKLTDRSNVKSEM